jgi:hypothetical protein
MLQEIMGHAIITTTLDLYGRLYPGDMEFYADRLDRLACSQGAANGCLIQLRPGLSRSGVSKSVNKIG